MKRFVLFPDRFISSAYAIDYEKLYAEGYRGIIWDIDNTLVPHDAPADSRSRELMDRLRSIGFHTCVVSNNREPRVKSFCDDAGVECYVFKASKPSEKGYIEAMEKMGTKRESTIAIGDQIFTDVWGARRQNIYCIMVGQVKKWAERPTIILKRIIEVPILLCYRLIYHDN